MNHLHAIQVIMEFQKSQPLDVLRAMQVIPDGCRIKQNLESVWRALLCDEFDALYEGLTTDDAKNQMVDAWLFVDFADQVEAIERQQLLCGEYDSEDVWCAMQEMERVQVWCEDKLQSLFGDALDVEDDAFVAIVKDTIERYTQDTRQDKTKQSTNQQEFEGLLSRLYKQAAELARTKKLKSKPVSKLEIKQVV